MDFNEICITRRVYRDGKSEYEMNGNTCTSARIGLTGASSHAQRLPAVEAALSGKELSQANIDAAASVAADGLQDVNSDIHASEAYRRAMVKVYSDPPPLTGCQASAVQPHAGQVLRG